MRKSKMKKSIGKLASILVVASLVFTMGAISSEGMSIQKFHLGNTSTLDEWHVYPGDSIQDAVDNASEGDTIYVHEGTYIENVDVYKSDLTLIGDGRDVVTVKALDTEDHTFHLTADGITMEGFTVMNSYLCGYGGICLEGTNNCEVDDNKCTRNLCAGIFIINSNNCEIIDNIVSDNDCGGIKIKGSNHNILEGNRVERNGNVGLQLYEGSSDNLIYNNYFNNTNGYGRWGNVVDNVPWGNRWIISKTPGTNIVGGPYIGGNYYADYTGKDDDGDGIGDTPYEIKNYPQGEITNKDYLPLVKNLPPNKPEKPSGPSEGKVGEEYTYTTSTTDPDGDQVKYGWDWNGDKVVDEWTTFYESGETCETSHIWTEKGTYNIRVKAQDKDGLESDWSDPLTVTMPKNKNENGRNLIVSLLYRLLSCIRPTTVNLPPPIPTVTGPTEGDVGVECTFCAVATFGCAWVDYQFDWGDGPNSPWYDNNGNHYASGESCCKPHSWDSPGTYCVKARCRPPCGHIGAWSACHYIVISGLGPALSYSPTSHDFGDMSEGETDSTTFDIWNSGTGTLTYSLSESCGWVDASPTSGSSTGEHDTITVDIDTTGLDPDDYSCPVSISSNGGSGTFRVYVTVVEGPELSYDPTSHDFGDIGEGQIDDTTFEIWNSGTGTLTYSLSESCGWVDASPTSGSSTGEHDTITVDIDTTGLDPDDYSCPVSISSNGGSGKFTVWVSIVNTPPDKPAKPSGPTSGKTGKEYTYTTSTTDPDGGRVKYGWDWNGDKAVDEWTEFYDSGEGISTSHKWDEQGTYEIRVKARDEYGAESDWSDPLPVTMPKNFDFLQSILDILFRTFGMTPFSLLFF